MNEKMIIPQGERAKYFVKSDKWNFSFEENNYRLELLYGMAGRKITIPKSEFQYLSNRWLFSFPTNDMIGPVKARLVMDIIDPDCPEGVRVEVDEQIIGFVVSASCPRFRSAQSAVVALAKSCMSAQRKATLASSGHSCATRTA